MSTRSRRAMGMIVGMAVALLAIVGPTVRAQNITAAKLTGAVESFDGRTCIFQVGTLTPAGVFTVNTGLGMSWSLRTTDSTYPLFQVGHYYAPSEIDYSGLPTFRTTYGTKFTLKRLILGVVGGTTVDQDFNRYEIMLGGPGGAVRLDGSNLLLASLAALPDTLTDNFSRNLADTDTPPGTVFTATDLPPGVTLSTAGVMAGGTNSVGYWNATISAKSSAGTVTKKVLMQASTWVQFSTSSSTSATYRTTAVTQTLSVDPTLIPPGKILDVRAEVTANLQGRYFVLPDPLPVLGFDNVAITCPGTPGTTSPVITNGDPTTAFNAVPNTGTSGPVLGGTWTVAATGGSSAHATSAHSFGVSAKLTFHVIPSPPDSVLPTVVLTAPAVNASSTSSALTISGTAADNVAVTAVEVRLNGGAWQRANGREAWSLGVTLTQPGTNLIEVRSQDLAGNYSTIVSRSFRYIVYSPLVVTLSGSGSVTSGFKGTTSRELEVSYSITATPATGWVFAQWTVQQSGYPTGASINVWTSSSRTLTFPMRGALMQVTAQFIPTPFPAVAGAYRALMTTGNYPYTQGDLAISLTTTGSFTGTLRAEGTTYKLSGSFNGMGESSVKLIRPQDQAPLTLVLQLNTSLATIKGDLQFTGAGSTFSSGLAERAPFSTKHLADPALAGRFHSSVTSFASSESYATPPPGKGYLILITSRTGTASLSGELADGVAVSWSGNLRASGDLPVFTTPYSAKGMLSGMMKVDVSTHAIPTVMMRWVRPAGHSDNQFSSGFTTRTNVVGQSYVAPSSGMRVMSLAATLPNVKASWSGDGVATTKSQSFNLSSTNVASVATNADSFTASLSVASGLWSASSKENAGILKLSHKALIIGNQAIGHYVGTASGILTKSFGTTTITAP